MSNGLSESVRPNMLRTINSMFDELPRTRVGALGKEAPAFRTCGIAGFYVAVVVLFGAGLITGRSLPVLAIIMVVSGVSFFAYTYLRRWITGAERLVLLEHVWFALAANAAVLWLMHQPVLSYLDVISVALCPFLAAGRVGCTLVGCCHGNPSVSGIRYTDASADDGFDRHLVGVRLFPVPAIECVGLLIIGVTGLLALPSADSGKVFAWYLLSYSILRFALEGLRGDVRPHWLGLSQARWMSIIELLVAIAYRERHDIRLRLLAPQHIDELRAAFAEGVESLPWQHAFTPAVRHSTLHTTVAISASIENGDQATSRFAHVSISLEHDVRDLRLLIDLAVAVLPEFSTRNAELTQGHVLHVLVPHSIWNVSAVERTRRARADELYGTLVRKAQRAQDAIDNAGAPAAELKGADGARHDDTPPEIRAMPDGSEYGNGHARRRYFVSTSGRTP
jgi:hypothetical protein